MNQKTKNGGLDVGVKSYLTAIFMILALMVLTYLLTLFVPGGRYARMIDAAGNSIIDPNGAFGYVEGGVPVGYPRGSCNKVRDQVFCLTSRE